MCCSSISQTFLGREPSPVELAIVVDRLLLPTLVITQMLGQEHLDSGIHGHLPDVACWRCRRCADFGDEDREFTSSNGRAVSMLRFMRRGEPFE